MDYFLDTYAMIEIIRGNKNYEKYLDKSFITTKYNLAELHFFLLNSYNLRTANSYLERFYGYAIDFGMDTISKAMVFRKSLRSKRFKISYIDCLGYLVALSKKVKYLTGDHHFVELNNVEFVR